MPISSWLLPTMWPALHTEAYHTLFTKIRILTRRHVNLEAKLRLEFFITSTLVCLAPSTPCLQPSHKFHLNCSSPLPSLIAMTPVPSVPASKKQLSNHPNTNPLPGTSSSSLPNLSTTSLSVDRGRHQHLLSSSLDSVVQLIVWTASPNSGLPWQMRPERETRSTGFLLPGNRILTNAHCVEDASAIRVRKRSSEKRYVGNVLHIADECDLAILTVEQPEFWEGMSPCSFGAFPALQDTVFVVGYPTGGGNICMTAGVVSRIDAHTYDHTRNTSELLAIQIDAAINDGNSGGPAFNMESEVVGVAFESSNVSQNSGYIIPISVVIHLLEDCEKNGKYTGMCEMRFQWQKLINPALKSFLGMQKDDTGVLINYVQKTGSAKHALKEGDVVCAIDGETVSDAGTVPYLGGPVSFEILVKNKFVGDKVKLDIIRDRKRIKVEYALESGKDMRLVPVYERKPKPEYIIVAGLVFLRLCIPYFNDEFGRDWWETAPKRLVHLAAEGQKTEDHEEVVVLARILTADINDGYQGFCDFPLKKFNNVKVRNLAHLAVLMDRCEEDYYAFTMQYNKMIVIDKKAADDSLPEILERHSISVGMRISTESFKRITEDVREGDEDIVGTFGNTAESDLSSLSINA